MAQTFKEAFCTYYRCKPEHYPREALSRCLYPQARAVWKVFELAGGPATLAANTFIELAGQTQSRDDLMDVITEYRDDIKPHAGFLADLFKLRVSIERLIALHETVRQTDLGKQKPPELK
jgi:hypothetical protein